MTEANTNRQALREARNAFQEKFSALPLAYSLDGRTFTFQGPLSLFLNPGEYVRITTSEGVSLLGQVLERDIHAMDGPLISIQDEAHDQLSHTGISVQEASIRLQMNMIRGSGVILGQGMAVPGFTEAEIEAASEEDVQALQRAWAESRYTLEIGVIKTDVAASPASIDARGFNRHTFMCGQSGSGKTYSLGVVLEQILLHTNLRVAVLDPNADYVKLGTLHQSRQNAEPGSDEASMLTRYLERVDDLHVLRPMPHEGSGDGPLRVRFSDLSREDQARALDLDPLTDREEFDTFWRMVSGLGDTTYHLHDVYNAAAGDLSLPTRQVLLRMVNLGVSDWTVWADSNTSSLSDTLHRYWRSVVLDVSRFERPIERSVVSLSMLRHFWDNRESREPVLLVIDEAHNVCPREPLDSIQEAATQLAISIAGEGRKYGIYLLLSTQRPDKLHPNVVSQCDNLLLMRMNSHTDLDALQKTFSFVPPGILAESLAFRQGEALLAGKLVASPLLVRMGRRISTEGGADVPTTWAVMHE